MILKQKIILGTVAGIFLVGVASVLAFASQYGKGDMHASRSTVSEEQKKRDTSTNTEMTDRTQTVMTVENKEDAERIILETESSFDDLDQVFVE